MLCLSGSTNGRGECIIRFFYSLVHCLLSKYLVLVWLEAMGVIIPLKFYVGRCRINCYKKKTHLRCLWWAGSLILNWSSASTVFGAFVFLPRLLSFLSLSLCCRQCFIGTTQHALLCFLFAILFFCFRISVLPPVPLKNSMLASCFLLLNCGAGFGKHFANITFWRTLFFLGS